MPVSLTTITGPVYLPNGATPVGGRVSFELSSWDQEEGEGLLISGPVYSPIDLNGQFSVQLYTSTAGVNSVHYRMFVLWEDSELSESYVNNIYVGTPTPHYTKKYIGSFALSGPGPFQVSELNIISETNNSSFDVYLEMKAFADRIDLGELDVAIQTTENNAALTLVDRNAVTSLATQVAIDRVATAADAAAADASRILAETTIGVWIDTLAEYTTDAVVSYNTGPGHVVAGDFIRTRKEGISLQVLAANATSYTHMNTLGVKVNLVSRAFDVPSSFSTMYDTGKFELLGGVLRQNPTDRSKWEFLTGAHQAVGFDPDPNMLASDGITPLYPRSAPGTGEGSRKIIAFYKLNTDARRINVLDSAFYDKIVACIVTPDEVTASQWGISIGARCTRTGIAIHGSMHKQRHARIYWDVSTSTFNITGDGLQPPGNVTVSWDATAGILTVNHDWLPGNVLHLQADMRATDAAPGGAVPTPFIPVQARIVSNTQFTMRFLSDGGAGPGFTPRTGAPGSGMSFRFTKSYHGELLFNGENGFDSIDWSTAEAGNLWCFILMRREAPL